MFCFFLDFYCPFGIIAVDIWGEANSRGRGKRILCRCVDLCAQLFCLAQSESIVFVYGDTQMHRKITSITALALIVAIPSIASATLSTDSHAIHDFNGQSTFSGPALVGHIDYAVYAPGHYTGSLTLPSDKYVYCYQLFDDPGSTVNIDSFYVGLYPSMSSTIGNVGFDSADPYAVLGGTNPFAQYILSQSVLYLFAATPISTGQHSTVLLFTSDAAPIMGSGVVSSGFAGGTVVSIPTVIPEPATLLILTLGVPAISRLKKKSP